MPIKTALVQCISCRCNIKVIRGNTKGMYVIKSICNECKPSHRIR